MLRMDSHNWTKTGIEFTDGIQHLSTVITYDGFSDWSVFRWEFGLKQFDCS